MKDQDGESERERESSMKEASVERRWWGFNLLNIRNMFAACSNGNTTMKSTKKKNHSKANHFLIFQFPNTLAWHDNVSINIICIPLASAFCKFASSNKICPLFFRIDLCESDSATQYTALYRLKFSLPIFSSRLWCYPFSLTVLRFCK